MSDNLNNTSLLGLALEKTELFVYSSALLLIDGQLALNDSRIAMSLARVQTQLGFY